MRPRDPFQEIACVKERLQPGLWRAELSNGHEVLAYASRAARAVENEICAGTRVVVRLTPFDLSKAKVMGVPVDRSPVE
ncbi:MAG: translation initiation factor IF-1 [Verrucomicrobia bacterium]|nr:translation initiation factor IF-1 [Verrucomicrobiota bacterium]